jgi:hypothetical protein
MTTLKDIRERWEKATPGPWKAEDSSFPCSVYSLEPNHQERGGVNTYWSRNLLTISAGVNPQIANEMKVECVL